MKEGRITLRKCHNHPPELSWLNRIEAKPSASLEAVFDTKTKTACEVFDTRKIMEALQNIKVEVNPVGDEGFSPLITAAFDGHAGVVQLLLQCQGIDVNLIGI